LSVGAKNKRRAACWDDSYREQLLFGPYLSSHRDLRKAGLQQTALAAIRGVVVIFGLCMYFFPTNGDRHDIIGGGGSKMPQISRFYGIVIYMYWGDHFPPHFHAHYGCD
jgi:hypothetical protein